MSFVHPAFFAILTVFAVIACSILGKLRKRPLTLGKYEAIDGLRGYLALFVFFHHSAISYFYVTTGQWMVPPSNLSIQLGQASVSMFFMITAFLFYGKVIENSSGSIDWFNFFLGRVFRLLPLYAVVVVVLLIVVAIESHGVLHDWSGRLVKSTTHWFLFTVFDEPAINGQDVARFMAGVNWSLPYEWYFYFSLPLLALTRRVKVQLPYILAGVAMLVWATERGAMIRYAAIFASGIIAAWLVRQPMFTGLARTMSGSLIVVACLTTLVVQFDTAYGIPQLILLSTAFALIAGGADLFGALRAKVSHVIGELSYSIYLLHGILLFVLLKYVVGYEVVRSMSALNYWALICALMVPLLLTATAAFRFIEAPGMKLTSVFTTRLGGRASVPFSDPLYDRTNRDTSGPAF